MIVSDVALWKNPDFNLTIALALFTVLAVPIFLSYPIARWVLNAQLDKINEFCSQVKKGDYKGFENLPNQGWDNDDENEFISLMRSMNWMAHTIKLREQELEQTVSTLHIAHSKLKSQTSELEDANRRLLEMAMTDPLTHLNNRRHFFEHLDQELNRVKRMSLSIGLLILDIDHFKKVNDIYGHQTGDLVLFEFATVIRNCVRSCDLLARVGGEEFAILMPDTGIEGITCLSKRIRRAVAANVFHDCSGNELRIMCSIGACSFDKMHRLSANDLYSCADLALYSAKSAGRNCIFHYDITKQISEKIVDEDFC